MTEAFPLAEAYKALAGAQAKMARAAKDAKNPHFRSSYADLASVMDACKAPLNEAGFAIIQRVIDHEAGPHMETILAHASGAAISGLVPLKVDKGNMQALGSTMTYARRYGLMALAGVAADDDDGNAAAAAPPPRQATPCPATRGTPRPAAQGKGQDDMSDVEMAHAALNGAADLGSLQAEWVNVVRHFGDGDAAKVPEQLRITKDACKAELAEKQKGEAA